MSKIAFKLAGGFSALRHALPGGHEISIDAGSSYLTDDPHEVAALDRHPAAARATRKSPSSGNRKKKKAAAAPAPAGDEEVVS
jgi:hypothetical protein